jgi:NADH-quinone oxidoreductase subunit B
MLFDAILKLHDNIQHGKLGANRVAQIEELELEALQAVPTSAMKGLMR